MTCEELYDLWAPPTSVWSRWVKPVLFSFAPGPGAAPEWPAVALDAALSELPARSALVVDLPGLQSLAAGRALARRGWQPVPLYNALPGPPGIDNTTVDVWSLVRGLSAAASDLNWPAGAPPAFLLDQSRRHSRLPVLSTGVFDNRSFTQTSDFPSIALLREMQLGAAVVLYQRIFSWDLLDTLKSWLDGGLPIWTRDLRKPGALRPWTGSALARLVPAWRWINRAPTAGQPFGDFVSGYDGGSSGG